MLYGDYQPTDMTKNILFLLGTYPSYGGAEKVTTILANEFYKRGYKVSIVSFEQPNPELKEMELSSGIALYKLSYPVYTRKNIDTLSGILETNEIQYLINQWCVPFYVAQLIKKATKGIDCKIISVHHNLPTSNARIKELELKLENRSGNAFIHAIELFGVRLLSRLSLRYAYQVSDAFVVLSHLFIPITNGYIFKSKGSRIRAISNPLAVENTGDILMKQKEILYVGRIEYNQKRVFRVVDAWREVQDDYPGWSLTIVGDGPDRGLLKKRIEDKGIGRAVITGFTNPKPYYERASILLLTSEFEGFGLVIIEGMSYGVVPIVYGSYPSVYDIIESGNNGFVTDVPYSLSETVKYMRELMDKPVLLEKMSRNARESLRRFSVDSIAKQWEDLFENLQ